MCVPVDVVINYILSFYKKFVATYNFIVMLIFLSINKVNRITKYEYFYMRKISRKTNLFLQLNGLSIYYIIATRKIYFYLFLYKEYKSKFGAIEKKI